MKRNRLLFLLAAESGHIAAQVTATVTGRITADTGLPLNTLSYRLKRD